MDGPGPSTQANAAARRALRATRRTSAEVLSGAQQSQRAPFPNREPAAEDEERKEEDDSEEDSEDEDEEDEGEGEEESWYDEEEEPEEPLFHWQIWRKLLRRGSMRRKGEAEGLIRYVNREPARGTHPLDVTAPMTTQMHWDLEKRSGWPNNLKLWQRPTPWINPTYNVGVMRYKGRIVHDFAGNPIRDFRIPLTISSAVEGLRIESWMRSDDRLTLGDIEARMWTKDGGPHGREPCYGKRLLSKRASLARVRAGLISWMAKKGRDAQTAYMDSLRTPANRAANQVRDEDLNAQQRAAYANMGLDESKKSSAPTRAVRIKKIKKAAGGDGAAAASSSGAANPDPADPVAAASSEESEDGDESQADPEAQDQEQASEHSWSSSIEDPLDSRNDFPTNPEEEALLQRALQITREEFVTLVGQEPAPTNPGDNYNSQWGTLQAQYRVLWAAADHPGHPVVEFGPPRLVARGRWTGGISRFEDAEEIEGEW